MATKTKKAAPSVDVPAVRASIAELRAKFTGLIEEFGTIVALFRETENWINDGELKEASACVEGVTNTLLEIRNAVEDRATESFRLQRALVGDDQKGGQ